MYCCQCHLTRHGAWGMAMDLFRLAGRSGRARQCCCDLVVPFHLSPVERRPTDGIRCGQVGAVPQQAYGCLDPALLACNVEWRQPPVICQGNVGTGGQQQVDLGLRQAGAMRHDDGITC